MSIKERWEKNKAFLCDFSRTQSFFQKFSTITVLLVIQLAYVALIVNLLKLFFGEQVFHKWAYSGLISDSDVYAKLQSSLDQGVLAVRIFFACILAPVWEEFVFRAYWFWKKLRKRDKEEELQPEVRAKIGKMPIWDFVVFSSIIFGIVHGGPINILIQGVGGLFLAYAFLKNGRCYWSAVALHAMYNGSLILFYFIGAKSMAAALTMPFWLLWF